MIEVYKYLNGHSSDIMTDILKSRENMYNVQNYNIYQVKNPRSLKHELDATPHHASQFWQEVPTDIHEGTSLALFKNCIKTWKCDDYPGRSCKISI